MGIPQLIYVGLTLVGLGMAIVLHGKDRDSYNIWSMLFSTIVTFGLLIWGGFFS